MTMDVSRYLLTLEAMTEQKDVLSLKMTELENRLTQESSTFDHSH